MRWSRPPCAACMPAGCWWCHQQRLYPPVALRHAGCRPYAGLQVHVSGPSQGLSRVVNLCRCLLSTGVGSLLNNTTNASRPSQGLSRVVNLCEHCCPHLRLLGGASRSIACLCSTEQVIGMRQLQAYLLKDSIE
jgi:hypothetical protein